MKALLLCFLVIQAITACGVRVEDSELTGVRKSAFCAQACPEIKKGNRLLQHEIFSLSNNPTTKFADWAAYRLSPDTIGTGPGKERSWSRDPMLSDTETLEPADYDGAFEELGVDRGHQVPLASFAGTDFWNTTNYLSNITPQKSTLNKGAWKRLEDAEREIALARATNLWVLTGPVYEFTIGELPNADEKHKVPSGYWKILFLKDGSDLATGAFFFEQEEDRDADICQRFTKISELSKKTGLQLEKTLGSKNSSENDKIRDELGCNER